MQKRATNQTAPAVDAALADEKAEVALLVQVFAHPTVLVEVTSCWGEGDEEIITNPAYAAIYRAMKRLSDERKRIAHITVLQELRLTGEDALLIERGIGLLTLTAPAAMETAVEIALYLKELWMRRMILSETNALQARIMQHEEIDAIASGVHSLANRVAVSQSSVKDVTMADVVHLSLEDLERGASAVNGVTGVPTGSLILDRETGGWQSTQIIDIAGRPGMCKTHVLLCHTIAAAKLGYPVAIANLEMRSAGLMPRIYANMTGIPYDRITRKTDLTYDEKKRIHEAAGVIEKWPIYFYDSANTDINDLRYWFIKMKRKYGITLAAIDYLQLCKDRTVRGGRYELITEISIKSKQINLELEIPIMRLLQLSRAVEGRPDRHPRLDDLKESGQLEQDASMVIGLYRDDYYKRRDAGEKGVDPDSVAMDFTLEYDCIKHRDGNLFGISFWCDPSICQIEDRPPAGWSPSLPGQTPQGPRTLPPLPPTDLSGWETPADRSIPF